VAVPDEQKNRARVTAMSSRKRRSKLISEPKSFSQIPTESPEALDRKRRLARVKI
jgi:hypothetical protein